MSIKHNSPYISKKHLKGLKSCIEKKIITTGYYVKKLENYFQKIYFKSGFSCAVSSGSAALFICLKSIKKNKKKFRVLAPTYCCSAVLNAIKLSGGVPVIADIGINMTIDYKKKHKDIDAIIAVNIYGSDPNITELKKRYPKAKIILDSCHSLGKKINNKKEIEFSVDYVVFSFYATKAITSGHGGLIWSNKKNNINYCKDYINFDFRKKYRERFNFLMSDFQAKILLNQIKELKNYRLKKIKLFNQFHNSIKNSNISVFNHYNFDKDFIYRFILIFKNQKQRDKVKKQLYRSKIFTRVPVMQFELLQNYLKLNKKKLFYFRSNSKNHTVNSFSQPFKF